MVVHVNMWVVKSALALVLTFVKNIEVKTFVYIPSSSYIVRLLQKSITLNDTKIELFVVTAL